MTSSYVGDQYVRRSAYYQSVTFSCDHYCAEGWRKFGPFALSAPEIIVGFASCFRPGGCPPTLAESLGSAGPDFVAWSDAFSVHVGRVLAQEPLHYPYQSYPLGNY